MSTTPADALPGALPPPGDTDWHTTAEAAPRLRLRPGTVRKHLCAGDLHGHWFGNHWKTRGTVADAWAHGLDLDAQRRICGCAPTVRPVLERPSRAIAPRPRR